MDHLSPAPSESMTRVQDGHRTDETYRRYRSAFNHISDGSDKPSSYTRWPAVTTAEQHGQRKSEKELKSNDENECFAKKRSYFPLPRPQGRISG